ncbi:MAG: carboxypeptidase regulatory-like domain-containing protein [Elusimicrobia bacterium]|nr:carboxypeptidase regulatory-like domain-containing protein [Elusimicrobiota bacterium]
MSVLAFSELVQVPGLVQAAAWAALVLLAGLMAHALNARFTPDVVLAPWAGRVWGALSWALCGLFIRVSLHPVLPAKVFGVVYWPRRVSGWAALSHLLMLSAFGAAAFLTVGAMAGAFERWGNKAKPGRSVSLVFWGAAAGAVLGAAGLEASRALFVADALGRLGFRIAGGLLLWGTVPVLLVTGILVVWLAARGSSWEPRWRLGGVAAALLLWLVPLGCVETALRLAWDFGRPGLAQAAGVRGAAAADTLTVLVLAGRDAGPGVQRREEFMAAEGLAVTRAGLEAVRRYLETQGYRTIFLKESLGYMRRGWTLLWEPERAMDAALVRLGPRFPPDYEAFLKGILVAPATPENYERLENMARAGDHGRIASVKKAGNLFQGLSDAYARFGDLENSNLWLARIRKLWPLYDDDVNVDPVEDQHGGEVTGSLTYNGRPASAVQVGLFMLTSTTTAPSAESGLVAAAWPDAEGRFHFRDLTPGRYYLALRADPILLGDPRLETLFSPGVFRLNHDKMTREFFPIQLERAGPPPPEAPPPPLPLSGAVSLPLPR